MYVRVTWKTDITTKKTVFFSDSLLTRVIYHHLYPRKHENTPNMYSENRHCDKKHRSWSRYAVARCYLGGQKPPISGICPSCAHDAHSGFLCTFHRFTVPKPLIFRIFSTFCVHRVFNRFRTVKTWNDSRVTISGISVHLCHKMCTLCALLFTVPNLMCAQQWCHVCTFCATDLLR